MSFVRIGFRALNRALRPLGLLLSRPETLHGSPAFAGATTWSRRLWDLQALVELVEGVDGAIVESGTHWGYGLLCFLHATRHKPRHIYGFDSFAGHSNPVAADRSGGKFVAMGSSFAVTEADVWQTLALGTGESRDSLQKRVTLVPGWLQQSMPAFASERRATAVALVHVDPDLYEPVKTTLESMWPLLNVGGIMLIGRLGNPELMGKTRAVEEFIAGRAPGTCELRTRPQIDTRLEQREMAYLLKVRADVVN